MEYIQWGGSSGHTKDRPDRVSTTCLGSLFSYSSNHAVLYYDADVTHEPDIEYSSSTARCSKDEVLAHIANLKLCGLKFTYSFDVMHMSSINKKADAHCFYFNPKEQSPVMRRFAMNGVRWISENCGCRTALAELLKEVKDKSDTLACFNMFVIAATADTRNGNHNIGAASGYIEPFSKAGWKTLQDPGGQNHMMSHVKIVRDHTLRSDSDNFTFLMHPGGYAEYQKRLEAARDFSSGKDKTSVQKMLRDILQLDAPTGGAVAT